MVFKAPERKSLSPESYVEFFGSGEKEWIHRKNIKKFCERDPALRKIKAENLKAAVKAAIMYTKTYKQLQEERNIKITFGTKKKMLRMYSKMSSLQQKQTAIFQKEENYLSKNGFSLSQNEPDIEIVYTNIPNPQNQENQYQDAQASSLVRSVSNTSVGNESNSLEDSNQFIEKLESSNEENLTQAFTIVTYGPNTTKRNKSISSKKRFHARILSSSSESLDDESTCRRDEVSIIPEITENTVKVAFEMQGKRNQSIYSITTDENYLKVMDIYDFPIILQRIFEKSPDQCYSISYLWRDIIKPFHLSIGFIGIEANGFYIIKALALFGHHVTFWDSPADSPKCNEAIENGAIWATSPAEVVSKCQVTFICVADDEEFSDIMQGQNGLLDGLKKCKIAKNIVQLSPISASCSQKHAEDIKTSGNRYLESPILGTRCNGENRLLLCCSGDKKAFQDLSDCLCGTGARAFFVSEETGAAYKYKDMFFAMKTLMVLPLIESLNYSTSIGCDPNILTNILNICEGSENKLKNIQGQKEINLSVKDASKSFSNLNIYNPNFPLFSIKAISDALMVSKKNGHSMQDIGTLNVMEIVKKPECVWKYTQVYK